MSSVRFSDDSALSRAVQWGHESCVRLLLNCVPRPDVNCVGLQHRSPLHLAVMNKHIEIVKLLMKEEDCDLHVLDVDQRTPLHYASWMGHLEIVQLLVKKGLGLLAKDSQGQTPMLVADRFGQALVAWWIRKYQGTAQGFFSSPPSVMVSSHTTIIPAITPCISCPRFN